MSDKPDLKTQFLTAEASVNEGRVQVPEAVRMKLYGLSKQVKEGDCRMPKPPDTNTILKAKWDAWTACAGTPVEKAMQEYVTIVDRLEPAVRVPLERQSSSRKSVIVAEPPGGVKKQGILYKQRDLLKGWRPRHFVLQDTLLSYYVEQDDTSPRNILDLSGCSVSTLKSNIVDGTEFFPFVITHPKTNKTYYLSCDSKLETDIWVAKILEAANAVVPQTSGKEGESANEPVYISSATAALLQPNVAHDRETRAYVPEDLLHKIEKKAQAFLELLAPDAPGWELMFEKNGLIAKKRPSGTSICVKGELQLSFNLLDVWAIATDGPRQLELDPQRQTHERIKEFSNHTWVDYLRFKGVWPTSPRDFVNLVHWRMFNDGSVLIFGFGEKFDDIRPIYDGIVRGEMAMGGYWLQPNAQGTKVNYLIHTDLKGSLGTTVINFVSTAQPSILSTMKKLMTADKAKGKNTRPLDQVVTYADLVTTKANSPSTLADGLKNEKGSSKASAGGVGANSSGSAGAAGGASAVPVQRRATLLKNAAKLQKLNLVSLFILFLPALLYYVVDSRLRSAGFLGGLIIAVTYLIRLHLGEPTNKTSSNINQKFPGGKVVHRFPVELGRLAIYLEQKIQEKELDITFTHVVVKAVAMVIQEIPSINGHLIMNNFYLSKSPRVDVSLSIDINESQSATYKIEDVDIKPLEYVSDEIIQKSQALRAGSSESDDNLTPLVKKLKELLPSFLFQSIQHWAHRFAIRFGVNVPLFGIKRFPFGVCTIVSSPSIDGETDMDLAYLPDTHETSAPITVTIGGIRILPSVDSERRVSGTPVLNFSVCLNSRAISINEGKTFCSRLQQFLNDPQLLEKIHQKVSFEREEALKRKQYFGNAK